MLKFAGDVCVKSGSYEKDGQTKNRYMKLGAYFQDTETGNVGILLQAIPLNMNIGKDGGTWLSLFPDKNSQPKNTGNNNNPPQEDDEAVPF